MNNSTIITELLYDLQMVRDVLLLFVWRRLLLSLFCCTVNDGIALCVSSVCFLSLSQGIK